jgi:cardiolipin synthase
MRTRASLPFQTEALRDLADQAFSRAAGAPLVPGNKVRLLKDASENYPAWIEAIESAQKWIHFETYIIHEDETGHLFADLLAKKAKEGVEVRLLYDWVGSLGNAWPRFWRRLAARGIDIRCFNPPSFDSPFGWISRDHRKMVGVDGRIAFVSGLCVGKRWLGYPEKKIDAWRDTGVSIEGPAVAGIERAFADTWAAAGGTLPATERPSHDSIEAAGDVALRTVASIPSVGSIYRMDQLVAALARRSLWLADAYFLGTSAYVQALRSAAQSGVDVRLLIPGATDVPIMRALSRAGLRPLLEAGVRVFEWNGSMMHAKTAVADGLWARVGSTNLNLLSWVGNWELDVVIENERFARAMEEAFSADLSNATEIVLEGKRRRPAPAAGKSGPRRKRRIGAASGSQAAARIVQLSHTVGAAITNHRELGPAERVIMVWGAVLLTAIAAVCAFWPKALAFPVGVVCIWMAASLVVRAIKLRHRRRKTKKDKRVEGAA